jgi:hypothetical protein
MSKQNSGQVSGAVFIIGLGIIFLFDFIDVWPGIMFVIGASIIARVMAEGKPWTAATGAFWVIGIGLVFWLGDNLNFGISSAWPLILILIGVGMLYRRNERREDDLDDWPEAGKRKVVTYDEE